MCARFNLERKTMGSPRLNNAHREFGKERTPEPSDCHFRGEKSGEPKQITLENASLYQDISGLKQKSGGT